MNKRYVVAFAGGRDSYQVPLSLHGTDQLECLVTDLYFPAPPSIVGGKFTKLAARSTPGLPIWNTRSSASVLWMTYTAWRLAADKHAARRRSLKRAQDTLSMLAGQLAKEKGSDLFLYAGYAR